MTTKQITLRLTPDEATTMLYLTNQIPGNPVTTLRKHTDAIGDKLLAAGVRAPFSYEVGLHEGAFCFTKDSTNLLNQWKEEQ